MRNAFIVYAREDRQIAVQLWDELRWHGLDVGIDLQDVPPHLERSAVLEDLVAASETVLLLLSAHSSENDERRRLHVLAIEQERDIIALLLPGGELPRCLRASKMILFDDYDRGFRHLRRLIPDHYFSQEPDKQRLLDNLHHHDADVRRTTLFLVGKTRSTTAMGAAISLLLTDRMPEVRAAAAWALDQLGNVDAVPALLLALHDSAYDVRSNAGWGLVNIGRRRDSPASRAVIPAVIAVLRDGETAGAREMAYQVLLRLGGSDAFNAIDRYWKD